MIILVAMESQHPQARIIRLYPCALFVRTVFDDASLAFARLSERVPCVFPGRPCVSSVSRALPASDLVGCLQNQS